MTKTIKQLYDEGQRQFPMRGGGVSPPLFIYGTHFQAKKEEPQEGRPFQVVAWKFSGNNFDGFHALDLLPQPLPDYQAKYEALVKACEPVVELVKSVNALDFEIPNDNHVMSTKAIKITLGDLRAISAVIRGK